MSTVSFSGSFSVPDILQDGEYNIFVQNYKCTGMHNRLEDETIMKNCKLPLKTVYVNPHKGVDLAATAQGVASNLWKGFQNMWGSTSNEKKAEKKDSSKRNDESGIIKHHRPHYNLEAMNSTVLGTTYTVSHLKVEKGKHVYKIKDCETRWENEEKGKNNFGKSDKSGCR
jgi:hypothetical protein